MVQSSLVILPNFNVTVDDDEVTMHLNELLASFVVVVAMVVVKPNLLVLQLLKQVVIV